MFLISHSIGPVLGNAVPLAVLLFNATLRIDAIVLAVAITAFWVFPFLLKRGVSYRLLVLTSVVNLNFCILWSCYFYGGVSSPTLPWLLIIPILSLFYIGGKRDLQPHLLAISAGAFAVFLVVYNAFPPPPMDMPSYAVHGLGLVSTAASLAYVATMAIYYARIFDASVALENEVQRRRETAAELREAIAAADRAGATKGEFLARMSHEIKTPLNAIIGYTQLLKEDSVIAGDPSVKDLNRVEDAAHYLLRLVDMILDFSKLEADRMQFYTRTHSLRELVAAAVEAHGPSVEANGNNIIVDLDPELETIEVDERRFAQVLGPVLENAGQHTNSGLVTLVARRASGEMCLRVTDTGSGIEPAVLETLFDAFQATRAAAGGRFGGTGLSLTVVHRLCRAMGGRIMAESTPGIGSTFSIFLPLATTKAADADERAASRAAA